jgi:hypothetical protein
VLGCSRKEKNGSTTSKMKTVTTGKSNRYRYENPKAQLGKRQADVSAVGVRKEIHQEALDTVGPFMEGSATHAGAPSMIPGIRARVDYILPVLYSLFPYQQFVSVFSRMESVRV